MKHFLTWQLVLTGKGLIVQTAIRKLTRRAQSAQREDNLSKKIFPIPKIKSIVTKKEIVVKKVS